MGVLWLLVPGLAVLFLAFGVAPRVIDNSNYSQGYRAGWDAHERYDFRHRTAQLTKASRNGTL